MKATLIQSCVASQRCSSALRRVSRPEPALRKLSSPWPRRLIDLANGLDPSPSSPGAPAFAPSCFEVCHSPKRHQADTRAGVLQLPGAPRVPDGRAPLQVIFKLAHSSNPWCSRSAPSRDCRFTNRDPPTQGRASSTCAVQDTQAAPKVMDPRLDATRMATSGD
jgi:hypothetical protein